MKSKDWDSILKELGFKKCWLSDKSGFWYEFSYTNNYGIKHKFEVDSDTLEILVLCEVFEYNRFSDKKNKQFEVIYSRKLTVKNLIKTMRKFDVYYE